MKQAATDVQLKGKLWNDYIDKLRGKFFKTQWHLYALCVSIGILYDKQKEFKDNNEVSSNFIPRTILNKSENFSLLEYMFRTAILTSRQVDFDEKTRLLLAFSEDDNDSSFNEFAFLTKFANYGLVVLDSIIKDCGDDLELMEVLSSSLNSMVENGVNEIIYLENDELNDIT